MGTKLWRSSHANLVRCDANAAFDCNGMHQNAAKIAELVNLDAPGWLGNSVTWVVDSDHGGNLPKLELLNTLPAGRKRLADPGCLGHAEPDQPLARSEAASCTESA